MNSTFPTRSYFILEAYMHVGTWRYLCFVLTLIMYVAIIVANVTLIAVICCNRSLHEPMYLFLVNLFVNELYGSTGLFPFLLIQILSDIHTISVPLCFLQIFCFYSYVNVEFCNLAVMSYDRYLAICRPLEYSTHMTFNTVGTLVVVIWLYSSVRCFINICLTVCLTLCGNVINGLYCHNYQIVKLACSDTEVNNIYGLFSMVLSILVPLLAIFVSYVMILKICFSASSQTRQKAVNTCTPHLTSLLNFSFGCMFVILQSRFDMIPGLLRLVLSLYFALLQPLLNPIMYGMQLSKIRQSWKDLLHKKTLEFKKMSELLSEHQ